MTQPDPGAQGGTEGAQSGAGENGTGAGSNPDTAGQGAGQGQDGGQTQGQTQTGTVSQVEYDRRMEQLRAADQKRQAAETELKQLKEKDLPAMEKLTRENAELVAERDKLNNELRQTRMDNAFFNDNTYKWKNPKTALKLADLSKVEIDDDGTVHNLRAALEALAKAEPYLLEESGDGNEDNKGKDGKGSTGALGTGGTGTTKPSSAAMAARVPALRSRGIGRTN